MKKILSIVLVLIMVICCACADSSNAESLQNFSSDGNEVTASQDSSSTVSQADIEVCYPPTHTFESATKAASHIFLAVCTQIYTSESWLPANYVGFSFYVCEKYGNKGEVPKSASSNSDYRNGFITVVAHKNNYINDIYADGDMCVLWLIYDEETGWYEDIYPAGGLRDYMLETQEELDARAEKFNKTYWQIGWDVSVIQSKEKEK